METGRLQAQTNGLTLVPSYAIPSSGTFWRIQRNGPLPYDIFPELPLYSMGGNHYLIDDTSVDYEAMEALIAMIIEARGGPFVPVEAGPAYDFGPGDLWIEIFDVTNGSANLTLHNTTTNFYQLLSRTNIEDQLWKYGEILENTTGTNQMFFTPVATTNLEHEFFRGLRGDCVLRVTAGNFAKEPPTATNAPASVGFFEFMRIAGRDDVELTVNFRMSGVASNGLDYTNLTGTVIIPSGDNNKLVHIHPLFDTEIEFDETVIMRLMPGVGYVIDTNNYIATNIIRDNIDEPCEGIYTVVATNLDRPTGIDYHSPSNCLIVSVNNSFNANPFAFVQIGISGTNSFVTNWSTVNNLEDEIKLATVKVTANGFTNGEMYFGTGVDGQIGKLAPDGSLVSRNWITLTNGSTETHFRGGFYIDQTGIFSNALIAVTGGDATQGGEVWRIQSPTNATMVADLSLEGNPHLEGVVTLTNDVQKWGPWAGTIITGAESKVPPLIHSIGANGAVASFSLGILPEDFDVIPPNQDLYCTGFSEGKIYKLSQNLLTNYVGDLLIAQEGTQATGTSLHIVHWDVGTSNFVVRTIPPPPNFSGFEHVTFAPINLPNLPCQ